MTRVSEETIGLGTTCQTGMFLTFFRTSWLDRLCVYHQKMWLQLSCQKETHKLLGDHNKREDPLFHKLPLAETQMSPLTGPWTCLRSSQYLLWHIQSCLYLFLQRPLSKRQLWLCILLRPKVLQWIPNTDSSKPKTKIKKAVPFHNIPVCCRDPYLGFSPSISHPHNFLPQLFYIIGPLGICQVP